VNTLKKLWSGLQPLPTAFCGYYVVGCIVVFLGVAAPGVLLIKLFPDARAIVWAIVPFIVWAYWITASVGVWRSASAVGTGWFPILAKIVVALYAAVAVFGLLDGGASNLVTNIIGAWNGTIPPKGVGFSN
jgi:hypothetical protein